MSIPVVARAFAASSLLLTLSAVATSAQQVRARVVDADARQPVANARAMLLSESGDTVASVGSGADGFFVLGVSAAGRYRIVVAAFGFAAEQRELRSDGADALLPAFVLQRAALPLDPVRAESERRGAAPPGVSARAAFVLAGRELANLERQSASLTAAVSALGPLRVSTIPAFTTRDGQRIRNYICVQSNRRLVTFQTVSAACDPVVLVWNGIAVGDAHDFMRSHKVMDFESIEYLAPVDAGMRYGLQASASGALVVWTRGTGPYRSSVRDERLD